MEKEGNGETPILIGKKKKPLCFLDCVNGGNRFMGVQYNIAIGFY